MRSFAPRSGRGEPTVESGETGSRGDKEWRESGEARNGEEEGM